MLCEKCKKNQACYHSTLIVNGNTQTTNLCLECANKYGEVDKNKNFFNNFFKEFEQVFSSSVFDDMFCPSCNIGFNKFRRNGFLGCPDCFDIFKSDLENITKNEKIQFNTPGKEQKQIEDLTNKLNKAIEEERYEDASDYNKQIKALKNKLNKKQD